MDNHSQEILELFFEEAKKIPGIFDIILRGSGSNKNKVKPFVPGWSDLDFSLIVEKITPEVRNKVRELYNLTRQHTDMKMSLILVDKEDFFTKHHLHAIKPMNYTDVFDKFQSLLKEDISYVKRPTKGESNAYKVSCYTYLSYYIHDVRIKHFMTSYDIRDYREFFRHLVKRCNVIVWNAVWLKTNYTGDTCGDRLLEEYPKVDKNFWPTVKETRANWSTVKYDLEKMNKLTDYFFENIEYIYREVVNYAEKHILHND
jgi:hypothetical protein